MVHADTILEGLKESCRQSPLVTDEASYATIELDRSGANSNVSLPVVEFIVDDIGRDTSRNTDVVGKETDDSGAEVGYRYTTWFDLDVIINVITVPQTKATHRGLEQQIRNALYAHDSHGPSQPIPHPDDPDSVVTGVNWLRVSEISRSNDFNTSPSLRGRQLRLNIGFTHELVSSDMGITYDQVEDVVVESLRVETDEDSWPDPEWNYRDLENDDDE